MSERDKYIDQIKTTIPERDVLEAIAEEATEVAKAALKMIRAHELSQNKTPIKPYEALDNLQEEIADLFITLDVWGLDFNDALDAAAQSWKWKRWAKRLAVENMQEKSEEENDGTKPEAAGSGMTHWYVCGKCKLEINLYDKYCHECGEKIKWPKR